MAKYFVNTAQGYHRLDAWNIISKQADRNKNHEWFMHEQQTKHIYQGVIINF